MIYVFPYDNFATLYVGYGKLHDQRKGDNGFVRISERFVAQQHELSPQHASPLSKLLSETPDDTPGDNIVSSSANHHTGLLTPAQVHNLLLSYPDLVRATWEPAKA